ncbi:MAG: bacterioferritin-associated ferredoxin [Desulfobacterales bacterium]
MSTQKQLIENFKKVCLCRSIKAGTIMEAIKNGSLSFEALRRQIGVGTGNCKAKRCRSKIEERIRKHKEQMKMDSEAKMVQ